MSDVTLSGREYEELWDAKRERDTLTQKLETAHAEIRRLSGLQSKERDLEADIARLNVLKDVYSKEAFELQAKLRDADLQVGELTRKLDAVIPLLRQSMENFDDDLEERPMRHSIGKLHRQIEVILGVLVEKRYCDLTNPACNTHAGKKASCGEPLPCKHHSDCETCGHGGLVHTNGFGCRWYGCNCAAMKA